VTSIGIDVGGGRTRIGVVDSAGAPLAVRREVTVAEEPPDAWIARLAGSVRQIREQTRTANPCRAIGLALPGLIDAKRGVLVRSVNLHRWEGTPLAAMLSDRTGLPVTLVTDADAATWGEYSAFLPTSTTGHDRSSPVRFVHLRLGTGVACGLVDEGRLQPIEEHRTGHLELLRIDRSAGARECPCGKRGCLEVYVGGRALHARASQLGLPSDFATVESACRKGDARAAELIGQAAGALAVGIRCMAQALGRIVICLGGGVLAGLPSLAGACRAGLDDEGGAAADRSFTLEFARLGDDAGVIGAALLAGYGAPDSQAGLA
jgi:glucokinase